MSNQHKYREALQNRNITPSEGSWEQLSEKMNAHESNEKEKYWMFLKYAAVILVMVSVGFYFFKPTKEVVNTPIIVAPTLKQDVKNIPQINEEPEVQVAESRKNKEVKEQSKKKSIIYSKINNIESEALALKETKEQSPPSNTINVETDKVEMSTEEILIVEEPLEHQDVDAEVEQLLNASKIKLTINGEISSKRVMSAHTLLAEVEDDLDKDFKEKLFEKILTTVKQPRKIVITDRGN